MFNQLFEFIPHLFSKIKSNFVDIYDDHSNCDGTEFQKLKYASQNSVEKKLMESYFKG